MAPPPGAWYSLLVCSSSSSAQQYCPYRRTPHLTEVCACATVILHYLMGSTALLWRPCCMHVICKHGCECNFSVRKESSTPASADPFQRILMLSLPSGSLVATDTSSEGHLIPSYESYSRRTWPSPLQLIGAVSAPLHTQLVVTTIETLPSYYIRTDLSRCCGCLQAAIPAAVVLGGCNLLHTTGVRLLHYSTQRVLV